jgi:holo-[acyl-carrier protein] synthase
MIYGIGVDLVKVDRIEGILARHGDRFLERVFTAREIAYSKALGVGLREDGIRWREVEVIPNPMGKPELYVSGRAAALCETAGIENMHLSLTDEDGRALAVVILER